MCQEQPSRQTQRQMQRHKDKHKETNTKAKIHFKKDYVGAPTPGEAGGCQDCTGAPDDSQLSPRLFWNQGGLLHKMIFAGYSVFLYFLCNLF